MTLAGRLPTTRWSLVLRAGDFSSGSSGGPTARQSLDELCQLYWPALYGYLRRRGRSRQDAEDLIQGFFTRLLQRESIAKVDASRGRFRAFLYTALDHYVANEHRKSITQKRGGNEPLFSLDIGAVDALDRAAMTIEIADPSQDPARLFDRQWALCLIQQTIAALEREYAEKGKSEWFAKLSPMLTSIDCATQTRQQIARELGLSATALKVAIHRLRASYREKLLDAVAQTLDDTNDLGRERQCLFDALGGP